MYLRGSQLSVEPVEFDTGHVRLSVGTEQFLGLLGLKRSEIAMDTGEHIFGALEREFLLVFEAQALDECLGCGELGLDDLPLSQ